MKTHGWGKYPIIDSEVSRPLTYNSLSMLLNDRSFIGIPRGMGRAYGDSALAKNTICTLSLNHFIHFEENTGIITCNAGVTFLDILKIFLKKGWFSPVTPGTKYITIGGAIASDIHGKNHHKDGSFCNHVNSFKLMLASGEIINCSRHENSDLFYATCGGMGLTGVIIEATFKLKKINSALINETTIKAKNIKELFNYFDEYNNASYSVAWIDCISTGKYFGRSLFITGEHSNDNNFNIPDKRIVSVPCEMPDFLLNQHSIKLFNHLYYHRAKNDKTEKIIDYDSYFYPLDKINNWNRIYGKSGFVQYQFVIPKEYGLKNMSEILNVITKSRRGSFLAVLKAFGDSNDNLLSFPLNGYTLALDFKINKDVLTLLKKLDELVTQSGGRIYLTKDARMSENIFKKCYPKWEEFKDIRQKYQANTKFHSLQSMRLKI